MVIFFSSHCLAIDNDIIVYSTQMEQGAAVIMGKVYYTKKFQVSIFNLSQKNIDLSSSCLKAYTSDNKVFDFNTVDNTLLIDTLEPMNITEGYVNFRFTDESIYFATVIKVDINCK
ncbi:DUF4354 family protein [Shewanella frigidimarina]|uniref:DUF4354 family protein n=1 Tax=Shewanella frigidimarina TaxID=56812 RepID=UPI003CCC4E63